MSRRKRILYSVPIALMALAPLPLGAGAAAASSLTPPGTCKPIVPFDAGNFERSTKIDNTYLPLTPGVQLTLEGRSNIDGATLPHTVVFTITDLVKKIDGVYSLVVLDVDISNGETEEAELSFWAQDKTGNVWNVGEYPEEYDHGAFVDATNTWFSGLRGAVGGIHMLADPSHNTARYLQGYSPTIDFLDCAEVYARDQAVCVPVQCYTDVLVTDETSPLEDRKAHQRKFHAPGIGIVQVSAVNDPEGETLVLVSRQQLSASGLTRARDAALRLERHAYRTNDLYQSTSPME